MTKHRRRGRTHTPARVAQDYAALEGLLDTLDDAMTANDPPRAQAALAEIWKHRRQMPEVLTRRLIAGRARVPFLAFELLAGFAGRRTPVYLERIAGSPEAADIVRFGAQRHLGGFELDDDPADARLDFFASLHDGEATLVEACRQAAMFWPPDGEILDEVLAYIEVLSPDRAVAVVERTVAELDRAATWLLHALLHGDDRGLVWLALREIDRLRPPGSTGAVQRLADTTRDAKLQREAIDVLQRVQAPAEPFEPVALPPLDRVLASIIDGSGTQVVFVIRRPVDEGAVTFANFLCQDSWGIKGVLGALHSTPEMLAEALDHFEEDGIHLVEVNPAIARGIVAAAIEENAASGQPIAPEFEFWEMLLHDSYPPAADEPLTAAELDDAPYTGRADLVEQGGDLLDHPAFDSWTFGPILTGRAMDGVPPPISGDAWTERQYRPLIKRLVDRPERDRLRRGLRRQAWLLDRDGERDARDAALATAAALADAKPDDLAKLPFLRHMVEHSVDEFLQPLALFPLDDDPFGDLGGALPGPRSPRPKRSRRKR